MALLRFRNLMPSIMGISLPRKSLRCERKKVEERKNDCGKWINRKLFIEILN